MPSLKYFDPVSQSYKYLVGQQSQDPLSGFRNVIRNGDLSVYQRGPGAFAGAGYTFDGWYFDYTGGSCTITRTASATPDGSPLASIAVSGQALASHRCILYFPIEGVRTLSGKAVTLSFTAYADSAIRQVGIETQQNFGTGGSPSASRNTAMGALRLSTVKTRYSMTFTVPSMSDATIGTNGTDKLMLILWLSAGSNSDSRSSGIGIQNGNFYFTDVQLEEGPVATPFERLPQQQQVDWCQRYFWRHGQITGGGISFTGAYYRLAPGVVRGGGVNDVVIQYPVQMRSTPTMMLTAASTFQNWNGVGSYPCTAVGMGDCISNVSVNIFATSPTVAAGSISHFLANGGATGYIDFSAEL